MATSPELRISCAVTCVPEGGPWDTPDRSIPVPHGAGDQPGQEPTQKACEDQPYGHAYWVEGRVEDLADEN